MSDFNAGGIANINTTTLTGNLARDGELRGENENVLSLRLAYNTSTKQGEEWGTKVNYVDIVHFGNLGKSIIGRLKKGQPIAISGELRQSVYEKDGEKVYRHEVVARSVQVLNRKNGNDSSSDDSAPEPVAEPEQIDGPF
jgi:single-strand DNA-binding protein